MKRAWGLCAFLCVLATSSPAQQVLPSFEGEVQSTSAKQLAVATPDGNEIHFHVLRNTVVYVGNKKVALSSLRMGQRVSVDARVAPDGSFDAVTVRVEPGPRQKQP